MSQAFQKISEVILALERGSLSPRACHQIWEQRLPVSDVEVRGTVQHPSEKGRRQFAWLQNDFSMVLAFVEEALACEEYLLVCDAVREGLAFWGEVAGMERPEEFATVHRIYACALARLGYTAEAQGVLTPFIGEPPAFEVSDVLRFQILMELGHILREESRVAEARAVKRQAGDEALGMYERALQIDPDDLDALALCAAAAMVLEPEGSARRARADELGRRILKLTQDAASPTLGRPWLRAQRSLKLVRSRGVAHCVLGDAEAAMAMFAEARKIPGVMVADLARLRSDARLLAEAMGKASEYFDDAFPPLQLVAFSGTMPAVGGQQLHFTNDRVEMAREVIRKKLEEMDVRIGVACASAGADLLFIEALLDRGGVLHLVLPWSREEFRQVAVRRYEPTDGPPIWEPLFERALAEAATVRELGQMYASATETSRQFSMEVMAGLSLLVAKASKLDPTPMVFLDRSLPRGGSAPASFRSLWATELGREVTQLLMPATEEECPLPGTVGLEGMWRNSRSWRSEQPTLHQEVKSMLFADIVGYSRLTEQVVPEFIETFLAQVAQLAAESSSKARSLNTWGDAIYALFDYTQDAGTFALRLQQLVEEGAEQWLQKGLYWEEHIPADEEAGMAARVVRHPLKVRVGLHTGPVFIHNDPVVHRIGFTGAHVNRAARIEPIANPGEIFASEEFAAMAQLGAEIAAASGGQIRRDEDVYSNFDCEYAGSMRLAKNFPGYHRLYRVIPRRALVIEELARAAHMRYFQREVAKGATPGAKPSLHPWAELPEDLREANRAQVSDIPYKLRLLGWEISVLHGVAPSAMKMSASQLESLAKREHVRWMNERLRQDWKHGPQRDNRMKYHPSLVPWAELPEAEREKDRAVVRDIPHLLEAASFRLRATLASPYSGQDVLHLAQPASMV